MKVLDSSYLRQKLRRMVKRFVPKGVILMYHRVAEVDLDPWSLCVTPRHFTEHLEVLQNYYQPVTLKKLAQAKHSGTIPYRAVGVTFDDGYADNLHNAKPLLEQYRIPATFFVTTGHVGKEREFWWDELQEILLQPGRLPDTLSLLIDGSTQTWELGTAVEYSEEDRKCDRTQLAWQAQPGSRLFFYYSVWKVLRSLPNEKRDRVIEQIQSWARAKPAMRSQYRLMSSEEVRTLGEGELVEVGAHTVTHPFLSAHATALQKAEIEQSKADLEALLQRPVTTFAYPYGDYAPETVKLAREAGFVCACSTVEDTVWWRKDRFLLPRFQVHNWNGQEFAQQLLRWFDE
jgi:peptidoglycan/xylan/chitin deacetylase (PgdA/CDA1 family)